MKDRYARLAADALQRMSVMTDHALDLAGALAEKENEGSDPPKSNAQAARCMGGVNVNGWDRISSAL